MVYRGRPSKSCAICRQRRIKCDREAPACGNCVRSKQKCPGYRNHSDLMFVDETDAIMQRAAIRVRPKTVPPAKPDEWAPAVPPAIEIDTDLFALSYCREAHIIKAVEPIGQPLRIVDDGILRSLKALGLASYATKTGSLKLARVARQHYIASLQALQASLLSATSAAQDGTLAIAIACMLYETLAGTSGQSIEASARHAHGMASILQCRDSGSFKAHGSRLLYTQATICLACDCIRARRKIPAPIRALSQSLYREAPLDSDPILRIHHLTMDVADLISEVTHGRDIHVQAPIRACFDLARDFSKIFATTTIEWQGDVVACKRAAHSSMPACVRVYKNSAAAELYNGARVGIVLCYSTIIALLTSARSSSAAVSFQTDMSTLRRQIYGLQLEVLSTVPQQVGIIGSDDPFGAIMNQSMINPESSQQLVCPVSQARQVADLASENIPALKLSGTLILVAHLGVVGEMAPMGSPLRLGTCKLLKAVGRRNGISQAFVIAASLEQTCPLESVGETLAETKAT